jgi:hypothetical protein
MRALALPLAIGLALFHIAMVGSVILAPEWYRRTVHIRRSGRFVGVNAVIISLLAFMIYSLCSG